MHLTAIVLAAGKGIRLNKKVSKAMVKVNARPLIVYCLKSLSGHPQIKDIILVVNPANRKGIAALVKKFKIPKIKSIIDGGLRRQDSVFNGLSALDKRADMVLIHDSARPFLDKEIISRVIKESLRTGAAIVGVPVKSTIKEVKGSVVEKTVPRDRLWEVQTPQVFKKSLIIMAYQKFIRDNVTDDAELAEKLGIPVSMVEGSYFNIKVTTPEDLVLAEAIARIK